MKFRMNSPEDRAKGRAFQYVIDVLLSGTERDFEELSKSVDGFPTGKDSFIGRSWICHAVDCGSISAVRWMLDQGVSLDIHDGEGYSLLHCAIERTLPDKYEILELLLKHRAPVNEHGFNDWTPAHLAAARQDIEALKILIRYGADMHERTRIDHYATPLEEAKVLKRQKSIEFLEGLGYSGEPKTFSNKIGGHFFEPIIKKRKKKR
jgi:ankyrin repeat protein